MVNQKSSDTPEKDDGNMSLASPPLFFRLPPELRCAIYGLLNEPPNGTWWTWKELFQLPIVALFRFSREMREEATHFFFGQNTFPFYLDLSLPIWLQKINPDHFSSIRHIVILQYHPVEKPTHVCNSKIELHLNRMKDGVDQVVIKYTDQKCYRGCREREHMAPSEMKRIIESLEVRDGCAMLTHKKLRETFEAARFHFGSEAAVPNASS